LVGSLPPLSFPCQLERTRPPPDEGKRVDLFPGISVEGIRFFYLWVPRILLPLFTAHPSWTIVVVKFLPQPTQTVVEPCDWCTFPNLPTLPVTNPFPRSHAAESVFARRLAMCCSQPFVFSSPHLESGVLFFPFSAAEMVSPPPRRTKGHQDFLRRMAPGACTMFLCGFFHLGGSSLPFVSARVCWNPPFRAYVWSCQFDRTTFDDQVDDAHLVAVPLFFHVATPFHQQVFGPLYDSGVLSADFSNTFPFPLGVFFFFFPFCFQKSMPPPR